MNSKFFRPFARSLLLAVMMLLAGLFAAAYANDKPEPPKPAPESQEAREELQKVRDSLNQLRDEHSKLKEENAQLRKENQQLRRLLADTGVPGGAASASSNAVSVVQVNQPNTETETQLTQWFTTATGKRHNSHCRYFKTTEGRRCGPDEGKACKLCGG
jgi:regulator of replication initiation timing